VHTWGITLDDIALYGAIGRLRVVDNLGDKVGDKWGITFATQMRYWVDWFIWVINFHASSPGNFIVS